MRKRRGWRERGDGPSAKESAGSVLELFIILSLVTATCGPFRGRIERREEREWELQTPSEIDGGR